MWCYPRELFLLDFARFTCICMYNFWKDSTLRKQNIQAKEVYLTIILELNSLLICNVLQVFSSQCNSWLYGGEWRRSEGTFSFRYRQCISQSCVNCNDLSTEQTNNRLNSPTNLANNRPAKIRLTIHRSNRTNHWFRTQLPITSWLNHQLMVYNSHDSEDDFHLSSWKVSYSQKQQFFSKLH